MRAALLSSFALAGVLAASHASAQTRDAAAAEKLFRDGRAAMKNGDYAHACPMLEESQRLDPAPGTLLNLADCEEKRGRVATAWEHVRSAIDSMGTADDRLAFATERAAELEKRLPKLTVRLAPTAPTGARVRRDTVELGAPSLGTPLPVDPGEHTLTVLADGRVDRAYTVRLAEAASVEVTVDAGAPSPVKADGRGRAEHAEGARGGGWKALGWVGVGVGGAALVTGAITGLLAIDRAHTFDRECNAQRVCSQTGLDAGSEGRTFSAVSTITFIAGAALVAGGIVWLVTH